MNPQPPEQSPTLTDSTAPTSSIQEEPLTPQSAEPVEMEWRWWHFLLLLSLLGPILAPLFRTIGMAPFTNVANVIYWLGNLISPTTNTAIILFGQLMAVPPLWYSALIAITVCALSYPSPQPFWARLESTPWYRRFGLILLLIIPWLMFYRLDNGHATPLMQLIMLLIGLIGGTGIALLGHMLSNLLAKPGESSDVLC